MKNPSYYRSIFVSKWLPPIYDMWVWVAVLGHTKGLRRKLLEFIPKDPKVIIDLATGTGGVALFLKNKFPNARVIGSDLSEGMLEQAKEKAREKNIAVEFSLQNAVQTHYPSGLADVVIISFAIHDLPHEQRVQVMKEAYRILKKDGIFLIYEYHRPKFILFMIPLIIQFLLVENKEARGILRENLKAELQKVGFSQTKDRIYYAGLAQIIAGVK